MKKLLYFAFFSVFAFFGGAIADTITINWLNTANTINQTTNMIPIFRPKTMTLNFDDGNGNVTSTTCEYGDTIVIPENVPTRTGYNFAGWVVRQNND